MKVLLVEDHPGLAKISAEVLREVHHHEVRIAGTGEEAWQLLQQFTPDVVLLDLSLPDMHGYKLAEAIRGQPRFDQTVLVAVTGFGMSGDARKSEAIGIDAHHRKPMDFRELPEIYHAARRTRAPRQSAPDGTIGGAFGFALA
jgi:CheY-like chemotaxis protein